MLSNDDHEIIDSMMNMDELNITNEIEKCVNELVDAIDNGVPNTYKAKFTRKRIVKKECTLTMFACLPLKNIFSIIFNLLI